MRRKKKHWKYVPQMTIFEKHHAEKIGELLAKNINPLSIHIHSINGSHSFTYRDIANYFEMVGKPFDFRSSIFDLVKKGDSYERKRISR